MYIIHFLQLINTHTITAGPVKSSFLDYLTLISKQGKILPLSVEQRMRLVKSLINNRLKAFDFDVLGPPTDFDPEDEESKDLVYEWDEIFDDVWAHLSAECPNLEVVREMRPQLEFFSAVTKHIINFKNLTSFETSCIIETGMRREEFFIWGRQILITWI